MISANDFKRQWADTSIDVISAVETVGESGWYILGSEVLAFESRLASEWGVRHCIGVASGLDALEIGLRILGCGKGDKVVTTPVSAFATTLAIVRTGATPVFVDCDDSGLMDLDRCETYLQQYPDTRFLMPVHLYGRPLDLDRLAGLRDTYAVKVVEDCAQSIGSRCRGKMTGTVGNCAATSFYPTKNLGAFGDGGAIFTNDDELAFAARRFRDYGQAGKYEHVEIGANSRLDELQAAILRRAHLPRLQEWTQRRIAIADQYTKHIRNPLIGHLPVPADGVASCWHLYPVFVSPTSKTDFMSFMKSRGIGAGEHYPKPIFMQTAMAATAHEIVDGCHRASRFCASEVSLPIHPYLNEEEVAEVIDACNQWGV